MKRILFASVALIAGTTLASAEVVDGRWSIFGASCNDQYADDIMTLDTVAGEIVFYESGCYIRNFTAIGVYGGAWSALLDCSGEGETWTTKVMFGFMQGYDAEPDRLALIYLTDGFTTIYQRCP